MNRSVLGLMLGLVGVAAVLAALCWVTSPLRAVFLVVSGLGVLTALGTVMARNLVHAALFLVAFFFLVACQFVLLEVDFLAAVQVLLYIGAVAILMMFGIMLTRNIQGEEPGRTGWLRWIPPGAVALGMLAMLSRGLLAEPVSEEAPHWDRQARPTLTDADDSLSPRGDVVANLGQVIGQELLGRWIVPFEMAGLLLTAALVGSVAVAMGAREEMPARGIPDLGRSQERTLR